MRIRTAFGMTLVVLTVAAGVSWGGSEQRLGTGGALELRLPVGARGIAMAGAPIGNVMGVEAMFYNPAGIATGESNTQVMFSNTQYIADMDVNFFGVTQTLGEQGTLGVSAKVLSVGEIPFTTEAAPDGTGELFSPTFATIGLTYGRRMTDRVAFGGTVSYVSERILRETAAGVAFDFGFQYDTGYHGMRLGMVMKNFGPNLEFSGSDFDRNLFLPEDDPQSGSRTVGTGSARFELPSNFQLGVSYPVVQGTNSLALHGIYQSNSYGVDEGRLGGEWTYRKDAALRLGYQYNTDDETLFGLSYGAGVRVPLGTANLWVDYAGQQVSDFFSDIHHVAVNIVF